LDDIGIDKKRKIKKRIREKMIDQKSLL